MPYTLKQNSKAKRFNYILIFLVCLILSAMYLLKMLWDKLIKTVAYLKNQSFDINSIIIYKLKNHIQPNLSYPKIVGFWAWIHIPKEKKVKLDIRSW